MSAPESSLVSPAWSFAEKIIFRLCFIFFGLYIFPFPVNFLPHADLLLDGYNTIWNWFILKTGKNILGISYAFSFRQNGSGDRTVDYINLFISVSAAVIGMIVWSVLDRNRKNYHRLHYWFTVLVRYYLAYMMFTYAYIKIFKLQFPAPGLSRLLEPYGYSSSQGLAWTFLGFSRGYNYFMGFAELIGGLLLLFKRTTTFGAFLLIAVTLNIVMINFCFDVSVKIMSTLYFLMAIYIAAPDIYRIFRFFFIHDESRLKPTGLFFTTPWKKITATILKTALIFCILFLPAKQAIENMKIRGDNIPKPKLYGYYNVASFAKNLDTLPEKPEDTMRWHRIIFSDRMRITVKMMNDSPVTYSYKNDTQRREIILTELADTSPKYTFSYTSQNPQELELKSKNQTDSLYLRLSRLAVPDFLLIKQGFHWISEKPFNR